MSTPFLGEMRQFGFGFAPKGWAMCNGQLMSIQQNSALFALLGTFYGGNGTTTFGLPDLRSRTPIHFGQGLGLSPYTIGQIGGTEIETLLSTQIPQHNHLINCSNATSTQASPQNNFPAVESSGTGLNYQDSASGTMYPAVLSLTGSTLPHTNVQPYLTVNYCIALIGIFPSRN